MTKYNLFKGLRLRSTNLEYERLTKKNFSEQLPIANKSSDWNYFLQGQLTTASSPLSALPSTLTTTLLGKQTEIRSAY